MKSCPFCAEDIKDAAIVCKHCGRNLRPRRAPARSSRPAVLFLVFVLLAVGLPVLFSVREPPTTAPYRGPMATPAVTAPADPCQPHVELHGGAHWAAELGIPEIQVLATHRIAVWERSGPDRGQKVGEMRVGSRAMILAEQGDAYRVRSPLDQSEGWVSSIQVARTLHQHVETREPCEIAEQERTP